MKRPWFSVDPVEETFFDTAPLQFRDSFGIALPAERVWADLTCENPMPWCLILQRIERTSPRPFGAGTTRTARTFGGLIVLRERFFRWEEGRRYSFFVEVASIPGFRRHAEDFLVEPTSASSCRFSWTVAIEPRSVTTIAKFAGKQVPGTAFRDTRRNYRVSRSSVSSTTSARLRPP